MLPIEGPSAWVGAEPPITLHRLGVMIEQLRTSFANLDRDTLRIQPPSELQALNDIARGLARIERDWPILRR
jgi:hypothetical protein